MTKIALFSEQVFLLSGEAGRPGKNKPFSGPPGPKGDQGPVGKTGAQGPQGAKGERGQDGARANGVNYVRWGRTSCPNGAQIVYQGKNNRWPTHWTFAVTCTQVHSSFDSFVENFVGHCNSFQKEKKALS